MICCAIFHKMIIENEKWLNLEFFYANANSRAHLRVPAAPVANRAHLRLQLCISSQLLLAGANRAHLLPTLPCIQISVSVRAFCAARR
jgi:hypothetical protein